MNQFAAVFATLCLGVAILSPGRHAFAAADPKPDKSDAASAEYDRRFAALKADDLDGHYQLALWCKDQEAWELLRRQCTQVLSLDRDHQQAILLQQLARRQLGQGDPDPQAPQQGGAPDGRKTRLPRPLTDEEIQKIRWAEFDDENEPKPLAVQFTNNVTERFLLAVEGDKDLTSEEQRRQFNVLSPNEKVRLIREKTQDRFAPDVIIKSDPRRMAEFEGKVLRVVVGGCATSQCHGGTAASPFALYTDKVLNKNKVYANYLILHEGRVGDHQLINREAPERSLLLTYGLRELSENLDPSYKHPTELKPFYRGPSDPRYKTIHEWIESLSAVPPDYGVALEASSTGP